MSLCECGCGGETNIFRGKYRRFIKGHQLRRYVHRPRTESWKKRIGEGNRGKIRSEEVNKKILTSAKVNILLPKPNLNEVYTFLQKQNLKKDREKESFQKIEEKGNGVIIILN